MSGRLIAALAVAVGLMAMSVVAPGRDEVRPGRGAGLAASGGKVDLAAPPGPGPGGPGPRPGRGPGSRRPDGSNGRGRGYRRRFVRLTKEQETELLKHLEKHQPRVLKHLTGLRDKDERSYRYYLSRAWGAYRRLKELPEDLRKKIMAKDEARRKVFHLLRAIHEAETDAEKKRLAGELRAPVTVQFEVEQAEAQYRLTQLAKEIERVREEIKARLAQRDKIIAERIERLMKMSSYFGRHGPKPSSDKGRRPPEGPEGPKGPNRPK